ncbi:hypothetical protein TvY486_0002000 [Trypanosoma vivax Y486]|uniref:Uncharacterized protein n=1 Tax=Trypanosoma vivax (strain Y486) TaxID=1055687 RepID=F9WP87_TRYVY|nr:hypothetical protein TvY486_0002000 [Trypanosoma vivax Y486]|eukprot:CCD19362.1 hypothetical protein TvY486_0002000 [Trypanosoma vivax Y486]
MLRGHACDVYISTTGDPLIGPTCAKCSAGGREKESRVCLKAAFVKTHWTPSRYAVDKVVRAMYAASSSGEANKAAAQQLGGSPCTFCCIASATRYEKDYCRAACVDDTSTPMPSVTKTQKAPKEPKNTDSLAALERREARQPVATLNAMLATQQSTHNACVTREYDTVTPRKRNTKSNEETKRTPTAVGKQPRQSGTNKADAEKQQHKMDNAGKRESYSHVALAFVLVRTTMNFAVVHGRLRRTARAPTQKDNRRKTKHTRSQIRRMHETKKTRAEHNPATWLGHEAR